MDIKLTADRDLDFSTGDLVLINGTDAIVQHMKIRLRFFLSEWFIDRRLGVPYFSKILIKLPNDNVVRSILRNVIAKTPGVESLTSIDFSLDGASRVFTVTFTAQLVTEGTPLTFTEELVI
jgi:hypothetical protein